MPIGLIVAEVAVKNSYRLIYFAWDCFGVRQIGAGSFCACFWLLLKRLWTLIKLCEANLDFSVYSSSY